MKVSDIMQRSIITVSEDTPLKEVARIIFNLGIAGIPVVQDKKLVGIITEQDILSHMYPTIQDIIEDYAHARNFDEMEKSLAMLLSIPVKKLMNRKVKSILSDTPLMRAQSLMLVNKFSRLPIVDKNRTLIGIISQGDIFRRLLRDELPQLEKERYAGFIARHYDLMVNWNKRFKYEFPPLFRLFKKEKVKSLVDLGVWTGEYTIGLARRGGIQKILGLDHNPIMIRMSDEKKEKLPKEIRGNVSFMLTDFKDLPSQITDVFDAAICMGNSLPYIPTPLTKLFEGTASILRKKNAVFIIQLLNFEKILKTKERLLSFQIQKSNMTYEKEHLFMEFFDTKRKGLLIHHVVVFDSDGENWIFKGITSVPVHRIKKKDIEEALNKAGFHKISFSGNTGEYQGDYGPLSFTDPFDPLESDWLNVVAKR